jgi:hypothetical protein
MDCSRETSIARFFISYRRGDSAGHTGRLNDAPTQWFGHDVLFRDIEDLAPGVDFAAELERALSECNAMLVVIGRTWATVSDDETPRPNEPWREKTKASR